MTQQIKDNGAALELIARRLESKRRDRVTQEVLQELYHLVDDYNGFIKDMDERFDKLLLKVENL
jgi:hypothetical protein